MVSVLHLYRSKKLASRGASDYFLMLGGSSDVQMLKVKEHLLAKGVPVLWIDHDDPKPVSFDIMNTGDVVIQYDATTLAPPAMVWFRTKLRSLLGGWGEGAAEEFVRRAEWNGFLFNIEALYRDRAIFAQGDLAAAANHLLQFVTARQVGFSVPHSRFFLGKHFAEQMLDEHPALVAKPINVRNVPKGHDGADFDRYRVLLVMGVDPEDVRATEEAVFECAPLFFQQRVPNGIEYRVVAFRERAFAYRCKDRVETRVRPDERMLYSGTLRGREVNGAQFSPVTISPGLEQRACKFVRALNLAYGTFDVIETDTGELMFLEFNPEGQWVTCGLAALDEVTAHFASELTSRFEKLVGP